MQVTVLGKSPSWQDAGGACSGYLVEVPQVNVLLDCGSGVFGQLRTHIDYLELDAIIISHIHADHILDLVPYSYALTVGPRANPGQIKLYIPPGSSSQLSQLTDAWGAPRLFAQAFAVEEYKPEFGLALESLRIQFCQVPHYLPTYAIKISDGEKQLVYGGDCGPNKALEQFAQGADLLITEATVLASDPNGGHLTPTQAGAIGRESNAKKLLLSHLSDELDVEEVRRQAEVSFGNLVDVAVAGQIYQV